jgi:hypothetical protein
VTVTVVLLDVLLSPAGGVVVVVLLPGMVVVDDVLPGVVVVLVLELVVPLPLTASGARSVVVRSVVVLVLSTRRSQADNRPSASKAASVAVVVLFIMETP